MQSLTSLKRDLPFLAGLLVVLGGIVGWMCWKNLDQISLLLAVPGILMVAYLYIFHFSLFVKLTVLFTPISASFKDVGDGFGMSIPNEPMIFGLGLAGVLIAFRSGLFTRQFLLHPVTLIVGLQFCWIIVTTLFSHETQISLKFLFARGLYVWVFYVFFHYFFQEVKGILTFIWLYAVGFVPVILYAMIGLGKHGFSQSYSPAMTEPYYDDHTVFGACLAMLMPVAWYIYRFRFHFPEIPKWVRDMMLAVVIAIGFSLIFSYSRAAWLSMIVISGVYLAYRFRMGPTTVVAIWVALVSLVVFFKDPIYEKMSATSAGDNQSLLGHASTVTDLEKDQSNLERVNRWASAVRMYRDHPIVGFGPGTYERYYGGYQVTSQMTRISTMDGDRGDAHSEYLGVLSEQGLPGMILLMLLFIVTFRSGMRTAFLAKNRNIRILSLCLTLGLFTYYFHGAVNSFLDIDKAATLFWAFTSMVVALDINAPKMSPDSRRNIPESGSKVAPISA